MTQNTVYKGQGYDIVQNDRQQKAVQIHLYKGVHRTAHIFDESNRIMFRLRVEFANNMADYVDMNRKVITEIINSIDLEMSLLEVFLNKRDKPIVVKKLMHDLVDVYNQVQIGDYIGKITFPINVFDNFVEYITYLSYQPFIDDTNVL